MADDIEKLEWRVQALEKIILPNGKEGLEGRLMGELRAMTAHLKGNYQQEDEDVRGLIKDETRDRKEQHMENQVKQQRLADAVERLEKFAYAMGAVFIVFKFFGIDNISKIFK